MLSVGVNSKGFFLCIMIREGGKDMGSAMRTTANIVENIRASFAMEDMKMTKEDERRVSGILTGSLTIDDALAELDKKYGYVRKKV